MSSPSTGWTHEFQFAFNATPQRLYTAITATKELEKWLADGVRLAFGNLASWLAGGQRIARHGRERLSLRMVRFSREASQHGRRLT
ncbi:MAG: hypothetical protein ABIT38_00725 [Gemmatimonadaceae bacterium]